MSAFELLDAYIENKIKDILKLCQGYEREALIEFVRSRDLHTYFLHSFNPAEIGHKLARESSLIKMGLSAVLKSFLPIIEQYEDGLPWLPSNKRNALWADKTLIELGLLVYLKRLAFSERFGLVSCTINSDKQITIQIIGKNVESLDLEDHAWLVNQALEKNKGIFDSINAEVVGWARDRIDEYVGVDNGWFIRYESDFELLELYERAVTLDFIKSPESEALPDEVLLGPRTFGEWKSLALMAAARASLHLSFATRLQSLEGGALDLRNLLTVYVRQEDLKAVWKEQTGLMQDSVIDTIADVFMLTSERSEEYYQDHENALPFHIRFGKYFSLLPLYGALDNPCTFLITELKRKYQKDWDRGVILRESKFRLDLSNLLPPPRYIFGADNYVIKDGKGTPITDIDASVFEPETNIVYLFQLKWFDVYGLSLKQRKSKLSNLLHANKWVADVWQWVSERDSKSILKLLFPKMSINSETKISFKLVVLTRYNARFSEEIRYDRRATWLSWPTLVRIVSESDTAKGSFMSALDGCEDGNRNMEFHESTAMEYVFSDLRVDITYK